MSRRWQRVVAWLGGHFWLPCPSCGQTFGGHEVMPPKAREGHDDSMPNPDRELVVGRVTYGRVICPACTRDGVGCRAWRALGIEKHPRCRA